MSDVTEAGQPDRPVMCPILPFAHDLHNHASTKPDIRGKVKRYGWLRVDQNPMSDSEEITQYASAPPRKRRDKSVLGWIRDLVVSLAISAFVIVFVYQPVKVEGTSMMPGLSDQERIFINKFVYRWEPVSRGDVVVFHYPYDTAKSYIKRVIGVAGDRVEIRQGWVYVNGELLFEPYVASKYRDERSYSGVVPEDSYFVMGDHRDLSNDSRDFGPIRSEYIYGKAVFAYWPAAKLGKLR
jgi:signal peptidase I